MKGSPENIEEIIIKYEKKIYNLFYSLSKNVDETKDLTQETFIKAYKKLNTFRKESKIFSWLYRIALNCWKNKVRYDKRHGRTQELSLETSAENCSETITQKQDDKTLTPEQNTIQTDTQKWIEKEIQQLPDKYKIALSLHIKNLSYEEIAEILKCRIATARILVSRAKKKLKEKILPYL
ncbi:MAG: sigma-70 family RNA polymerase sigma factor [Elusimicrobiota bacterium]